ncbi:Ig-like domain-containing protein [Vibrio parahaemolyticus]
MNKYFKSLFAVVIFPLLMLLTGCNSEGAFSESTVKLERIDITTSLITTRGVSGLTLAVGNKQPFEAVGHYSDGSSRTLTDLTVSDWHTSNSDAGRFDVPGVFTATNVGNTTLTATKDGVTSNAVDVNVSAAVITSIQVTPSPVNVAKGQTQQLVADATYSDGSSSAVTNSVTWTPDNTATATVSSAGLLTGVDVGNTTLTATKDGVTSNTVDVNVSAAVITSIQVTPSPVNIIKGQTQQLVADATYSDGSSSAVTNSVTWTSDDTATATVSSAGLLTGVDVGNTTLTAMKDGVTSNTVDVNVCDLAGTCIDIFDTGTGKLFTNSPSVAYLDSIGGSATDDIGTDNPVGNFYLFNWTNANALCTTYNTLSLGGRTNWRLATRDELKVELYEASGNMFTARGWPATYFYWSATPAGSRYYSVALNNGNVYSPNLSNLSYASCVSNP